MKKLKAFIPTINPEQAKIFYGDVLGFNLISEDDYGFEFEKDGNLLRINIVENFKPHPFTVLGWNVDGLFSEVKNLIKKGVEMERYNSFEQDELSIWISPSKSKIVWFKDPDGNLLSLSQLKASVE